MPSAKTERRQIARLQKLIQVSRAKTRSGSGSVRGLRRQLLREIRARVGTEETPETSAAP